MKKFRVISSVTIVVLCLLLGVNIYYLFGLYGSITDQTRHIVRSALADADLDEVLNRMQMHPPDSIAAYTEKTMTQSRSIQGDTLCTTIIEQDSVIEVRKALLAPGTNYSDIMVMEIRFGAHETLDPYYPVYISDIDSLFRHTLARQGIFPEVATVVQFDGGGNVVAGDTTFMGCEGIETYEHEINGLTGEKFVAYVSPLTRHVLGRMRGVIATTAATVLVLAFAFWYLIHTVVKLRTIEEMKDDFVNNMTHELKTPIAIAYSANDALLNFSDLSDREKSRRYLTVALEQLTRLGALVENILSMSMERRKAIVLVKERIELRPFIEEIVSRQLLRAGKPCGIDVTVEPENLEIEADSTHLANIIDNLIDNALKYSGDEAEIRVVATSRTITVSDNGIGIPAKSLPLVFNKFYRVPNGNVQDVRGYGIGLYYVKSILERMGWTIEVKSRENVGSKFIIKMCK